MHLKKNVVQHVKNFLESQEQNVRWEMHKNRSQLLVAEPLIPHDNARPHIEDIVTKNVRIMGGKWYLMRPNSPDMSPPDFDLFPKLKEPMRERCFSSLEERPTDVTRAIRHMLKVVSWMEK